MINQESEIVEVTLPIRMYCVKNGVEEKLAVGEQVKFNKRLLKSDALTLEIEHRGEKKTATVEDLSEICRAARFKILEKMHEIFQAEGRDAVSLYLHNEIPKREHGSLLTDAKLGDKNWKKKLAEWESARGEASRLKRAPRR